MHENLNWESFSEQYHLKNDKYVQDVALLQRLQKNDCYPVILYPKLLCEQLSKKFIIGSIGVGKDKSHIFLHDFLNAATQLNIKVEDKLSLIQPFDFKDAVVPQMPNIPTEKTECYEAHNWGCLILILIMAVLFTLPAFFISPEDPGLGVIVAKMNVGKPETKVRTRKLTQNEIDQLRQEALKKYQDNLEAYRKLRAEYDGKKIEFEKRLDSQAQLLDKHSNLIVASIFKRCLITYHQIQDNNKPPQRGAFENNLFYALMKEFPSYTKIDKILGPYSPDLVLSNGCSCPIDIEIDEPYDFQTKKEIHYIGCGDEERNKFFVQNDWFVLRFSENQIKNHLFECVDIVKALIHFIECGDTSKLNEIESIIIQIQEPRWSKEKSRMLAIENYRTRQY